jgi:ribosomal protein S18 acetylase RimI-like enzyme
MNEIKPAQLKDVSLIKGIASANKDALGFIVTAKILDAIQAGRVIIATGDKDIIGFLIFRHRKFDRQTTISEICVCEKFRCCGFGRSMVEALFRQCIDLGREFILLKCPENLPANGFYRHIGFDLLRTEPGKKRRLNVWIKYINKGVIL